MDSTLELLEAVRRKHNSSYYGLQRILGVSKQAISRYRKRHGFFDDEVALTVADELGLPHAHVLAIVAAERTKSERVRKAWQRAAAATAAAVLVVLGAEHGAQVLEYVSAAAPALYIMSNAALAVTCALALATHAVLYSQQRRQQ